MSRKLYQVLLGFVGVLSAGAAAGGCATGRAAEVRTVPPALLEELQAVRGASSESYKTYVVQPKDTLWAFSQRFGTCVEAICRANGISETDPIKVGQRLEVPVRAGGVVEEMRWEGGRVSEKGLVWSVRGRVVGKFGEVVGGVVCKGIEVEAAGGEDVVASGGGNVEYVSEGFRGLGKVVVVSHGGGVWVLYGRLGSISVGVGDEVRRGESIGKAVSGAGKTNVHLRLFDGDALQDPLEYLP